MPTKRHAGRGYLICFRRADDTARPALYQHAGHYLGFTVREVKERLDEHLKGQASPLTKAAVAAGLVLVVSRTWDDITRDDERRLKNNKGRYCPVCTALKKALCGSSRASLKRMHETLDARERRRQGGTDGVTKGKDAAAVGRAAAARLARL